MSAANYEAKKAYFARVQRKNYMASLRLEGFEVRDPEPGRKRRSRTEVIAAHKRKEMA